MNFANTMKKPINNQQSTINKRFGFTFIEILVVATIIGVLAAIGTVSYQSANKKSRDGKRKADIEQIRAALEMYRADEGEYPTNLSSLTSGGYMQSIPTPPVNSQNCSGTSIDSYGNIYNRSSATTYSFCIDLESETGNYSVTNP